MPRHHRTRPQATYPRRELASNIGAPATQSAGNVNSFTATKPAHGSADPYKAIRTKSVPSNESVQPLTHGGTVKHSSILQVTARV